MRFKFDFSVKSLLIIFMLISTIVSAAIDLTGIGTRAQSMGGNFRSIADDYSAMFWNPAGLAFQEGSHLGFSMTLVNQSSSYLAAPSPFYQERIDQGMDPGSLSGLRQYSATYAHTAHSSTPLVAVPSIGFYQSHDKWSWGIGAWAAFGIRASFDLIGTSNYNQTINSFPDEDWEDDMKFIDIHPTVAYRISEQLSVGAGVSLMIADIYLRKPAFSPMNPYISNTEVETYYLDYVSTLPESYQRSMQQALLEIQSSPKDHVIADTYLTGFGLSTGGNIGFMFKPNDKFSIGASIQYYNDVPLEGDATIYTYYPYQADIANMLQDSIRINNHSMEGLLSYYKRLFQSKKISFEDYYVLPKIGTGLIDTLRNRDKIRADMSLPIRMGIGISYTGIDHFIFAADVGISTWSAWDVFHIYDEDDNPVSKIEKNWKDVIRFGIGIEYAASLLKLRSGFYTESRAAVNATMVPTNPDVSRRNVFSFGAELPAGKYRFHLCFEHMFMKDLDIETWVPFDNELDYKNMAGHYSASMQNFMFGMDVEL
ncbi:outer membrane protein transport protein [bacterium]|nr:outer membrane protein transport protein [bacterium]